MVLSKQEPLTAQHKFLTLTLACLHQPVDGAAEATLVTMATLALLSIRWWWVDQLSLCKDSLLVSSQRFQMLAWVRTRLQDQPGHQFPRCFCPFSYIEGFSLVDGFHGDNTVAFKHQDASIVASTVEG